MKKLAEVIKRAGPWIGLLLVTVGAAAYFGYLWLLLVVLACGFSTAIGAGWICFRLSLPRVAGRQNGKGLDRPLRIIRDSDYVPHIYAETKLDAYWGLGYAHAQDRLWQMEFQRRTGKGRVAEILGKRVVSLDKFTRTLGVRQCAEKIWSALPPETKRPIESYIAGINAFIEGKSPLRLGPEFALLRIKPELWTGVDVVVISKMMAWSLSAAYVTELLRSDLIESLGPERARTLMPDFHPAQPEGRPDAIAAETMDALGTAHSAPLLSQFEESALRTSEGIGSNMWAVGPGRSQSGAAALANDPHMLSSLPSTWYLAHLSAPGLETIGATVPGIPAIVIGRNRRIAWGMTNLNPDVQDFFRERLDEGERAAEFQQQWEPLDLQTERICLKGGGVVELLTRKSRHGPLMTDVIDAAASELPMAGRNRRGDPLALQWTGLLEEDRSLDAFFRLNEAEDWGGFTAALRNLTAPAVNFIYADTEGNIGYHAAGKIPVRCERDGSAPAEGWSGRDEWRCYVPFEELPHAYNPASGYIISTNNAPPPPDYPWLLSKDWVEPYRAQRIRQVLEEKERLEAPDHMRLQGDILSVHAQETLPQLLALLPDSDPELRPARDLLRQWDYLATKSSPQAAIFTAWWRKLPQVILENELDAKVLKAYEGWSSFVNRFVMGVMTGQSPAPDLPSRLAQKSLRLALAELRARLGPEIGAWRWHRLHFAVLPHYPFHSVPWLRPFFSRRVPRGGDWSSVNFSPSASTGPFVQRNIPGYRQVVDLSDLDCGWFILAGGQSGHFLSPHYADFLKDWDEVRYRKMRFSPQAVAEDAKTTLLFDPVH